MNEQRRSRSHHGGGGGGGGHHKKLSHMLSRLLRHSAVEEGVCIQEDGFVKVKELPQRFNRYSVDDLKAVTENNDKQRFTLKKQNDEWFIRANQGHSIKSVKPELLFQKVDYNRLKTCVHGTTPEAWEKIKTTGLSRMGRTHIHFAKGLLGDSGVISGMRKSATIYIYLDIKAAEEGGLELLESSNGVILCKGEGETGIIPAKYFSKVVGRDGGANLLLTPSQGGIPTHVEPPSHNKEKQIVANKRTTDNLSNDMRKKPKHDKKLSHMLSRVLRHSAVDEGVPIRDDGFVKVKELPERFQRYSIGDLKSVTSNNDKQRFTLKQEGSEWLIRANQGHSIRSIKPELIYQKVDYSSLTTCVHGTTPEAWEKIKTMGLSRMGRTHVHFAKGILGESGVISGMRKSASVYIYLDIKAAEEGGLELLESSNGVILCKGEGETGVIPPQIFFCESSLEMVLMFLSSNNLRQAVSKANSLIKSGLL